MKFPTSNFCQPWPAVTFTMRSGAYWQPFDATGTELSQKMCKFLAVWECMFGCSVCICSIRVFAWPAAKIFSSLQIGSFLGFIQESRFAHWAFPRGLNVEAKAASGHPQPTDHLTRAGVDVISHSCHATLVMLS